jgi:tetratricopeptide (TPR) repeat protein
MAGPSHLSVVLLLTLPASIVADARAVAPQQTGASQAEVQARLKRVSSDLFTRTDRAAESIRELKAILAIDPRSAEAHMLLGIAYRGQNSPDLMGEAVAELRQALAIDPGLAPARLYLSYVYLDLGRVDRARDELQIALEKFPGQPQFLALLGDAERRLKNPARAVDVLQKALAADPSSGQARYYLGLAYFDLGKRAEAIKELEMVLQSGVQAPEAFVSLGTAYLDAGRVDEGLEILSRGTHIDASRPDTRIQLARAYRLKGQLAQAEEQLKVAEPRVRTVVATSFAHQPQVEFDYLFEQGMLAARRGRLTAAVDALKKALDIEPDDAATHRELAQLYTRLGNTKLAAQHTARAKALSAAPGARK